jgi:hypothetical protein
MFFRPEKVREMWDTWLYYHEGTHYLYYLHKSAGERWDGMSVATSTDGVHYEEVGPILHIKDDARWLGTGSVWRAGDKFILNFSESRNGVQAIFFAQSDDLIHWERLGDELRSDPDPRWYDNTKTGRWDCIWAIPKPNDGGFWGYLTARPWDRTRGRNIDSIGMVESEDGIHWRAVPPPAIDWGDWPQMSVGPEVGAIERINGRYYLMRCYSECGLGGRQIGWDPWQKANMYTFVADNPEGPFVPDRKAYRLLVSNGTHFARFYPSPDGMLVNYHCLEVLGDGSRIWMAPLKKAVMDADGHLQLGYWSGNDQVKGKQIEISLASSVRVFPGDETARWTMAPNRLEADDPIKGGIAMLANSFDTQRGLVLEGSMQILSPPKCWGGVGVYIEHDAEAHSGTGIMFETRGLTELATMNGQGAFSPIHSTEIGIEEGRKQTFRLLLRRTMMEIYLDDRLVQCHSLPGNPTGLVGLTFESGRAVFEDLRAWEMNL